MKVLLDACVPRPLRQFLPDHTVRTAQEMGWGRLKNGALLQVVGFQFLRIGEEGIVKLPEALLFVGTQ